MKSNDAMNLNVAIIAGVLAVVVSNYREPYSYASVVLLLIAAIFLQRYLHGSRQCCAEKEKKEAERQEETLSEIRNMGALVQNKMGQLDDILEQEKAACELQRQEAELIRENLDAVKEVQEDLRSLKAASEEYAGELCKTIGAELKQHQIVLTKLIEEKADSIVQAEQAQILAEKEQTASHDKNIELLMQKFNEYGQQVHQEFEQEKAVLERVIAGIDKQWKVLNELPQCLCESLDEMQDAAKKYMEEMKKDRQQFLDQIEDTAYSTAKKAEKNMQSLIDSTNAYEENLWNAMQQLSGAYQQFEKLTAQILEQMNAMSAEDLSILKQYFDTAENTKK